LRQPAWGFAPCRAAPPIAKKGEPMDPAEEFRRHADECHRMARGTRDPDSKAAWSRMAERWLRCAELAGQQRSAAQAAAAQLTRHRRGKFRWPDNHVAY
jgi:hypothetical protein